MVRLFSFILSLLVLSSPVKLAFAQGTITEGVVREKFSQIVEAGGPLIAGLMALPVPEVVEIDALRILIPSDANSKTLCYRATTQDGLYLSRGTLAVPNIINGRASIKAPGYPQFGKPLGGYSGRQFAARVVIADSCAGERTGTIIPVAFGTETVRGLSVLINSQGAITIEAELEESGSSSIHGECEFLDSRTVAFDAMCTLSVRRPKQFDLIISRMPKSGRFRKDRFRIDIRGMQSE